MRTAGAPDNRRAIAFMAVGVIMLSANDAIMKHAGASVPVGQMLALRGAMLCAVLVVACRAGGIGFDVASMRHRWCLARAAFEVAGTYLFVTSLMFVPIAVATTLVLSAPIGLTALSGPLHGERVGPWRWGAVVAGFCGVVLIAAPGTGFWQPAMALPLATAVALMGRELSTRRIPAAVPTGSAVLGSAVAVTVGGLLSIPWGWSAVSPGTFGWLALAAVFIAGAYLGGVIAMRTGELSVVAPIFYIAVPCAVFFGAVFWSEFPGTREMVGGTVIVASNLLILHRERVHHRPLSGGAGSTEADKARDRAPPRT